MFLQALVIAVNEKRKPYGMEMNIIKTKSMVINRKKPEPNISISVERETNPTSGRNGVAWLHGNSTIVRHSVLQQSHLMEMKHIAGYHQVVRNRVS